MSSYDFENFYESCFGDSFGTVRDGVDPKAILKLQGEEREQAERLLLQALEANQDRYNRPVIALGLLGSQKALEPLKKRFENAVDYDRIQTALALFQIEPFPEAGQIIIDCFKAAEPEKHETLGMLVTDALPCLGRTPQVVQALLEIMAENNHIGFCAARSLRTLFIEDESIRDALGQILLIHQDVHRPDFVSRPELVKRAAELIHARGISSIN
jgi:hypothetical protein